MICKVPHCTNKARPNGYCRKHKAFATGDDRVSASKRGYGVKWRRARAQFLALNPFCVICSTTSHPVRATDVDHIIAKSPHDLAFWDVANWQPLCHACHSRKTATQDSAFANKGRTAKRFDAGPKVDGNRGPVTNDNMNQ